MGYNGSDTCYDMLHLSLTVSPLFQDGKLVMTVGRCSECLQNPYDLQHGSDLMPDIPQLIRHVYLHIGNARERKQELRTVRAHLKAAGRVCVKAAGRVCVKTYKFI